MVLFGRRWFLLPQHALACCFSFWYHLRDGFVYLESVAIPFWLVLYSTY